MIQFRFFRIGCFFLNFLHIFYSSEQYLSVGIVSDDSEIECLVIPSKDHQKLNAALLLWIEYYKKVLEAHRYRAGEQTFHGNRK